jgi:hypothetical protein
MISFLNPPAPVETRDNYDTVFRCDPVGFGSKPFKIAGYQWLTRRSPGAEITRHEVVVQRVGNIGRTRLIGK